MTKQELLDYVRKLTTSEIQRFEQKLTTIDDRTLMERGNVALSKAHESIPKSVDEVLSSLVPDDEEDLDQLRDQALMDEDVEKRRKGADMAERHNWEVDSATGGYIDNQGTVRNSYGEVE